MIDADDLSWKNRERVLRAVLLVCTTEEIIEAMADTLTEAEIVRIWKTVESLINIGRFNDKSV